MNKPVALSAVCLLVLAALPLAGQQPRVHVLKPTPRTVTWGYYDAKSRPVLTIKSGDTVVEVLGLREVRVAAEQHLAKAAAEADGQGTVYLVRGALVRRAVGRAVDQAHD